MRLRRPWLIAIMVAVVGGGLLLAHERSTSAQLVAACRLDDTLRKHKLTPENLVGAVNDINARVDGGLPITQRLFALQALICDESLRPGSRLFAIDVLLENVAILTVLSRQQSERYAWGNSITGTVGVVNLLETRSSNDRVCSVLDYPSMHRSVGSVVIIRARERYCRKNGENEWFSEEMLRYDAYRIEDPAAGPKQKT